MKAKDRRELILKTIIESEKPISASALAKLTGVSRQIIVGDVALLRASQHSITATPKGYVNEINKTKDDIYVIACHHDASLTRKELEIIVDCGGAIVNVIVSHPIYGELVGKLDIESRLDIDEFMDKIKRTNARNLSEISGGVHLHTIRCKNDKIFNIIKGKLKEAKIIYETIE